MAIWKDNGKLKLLIIVGDDNVIAKMVSNDRRTRRYSGLRARLVQESQVV